MIVRQKKIFKNIHFFMVTTLKPMNHAAVHFYVQYLALQYIENIKRTKEN